MPAFFTFCNVWSTSSGAEHANSKRGLFRWRISNRDRKLVTKSGTRKGQSYTSQTSHMDSVSEEPAARKYHPRDRKRSLSHSKDESADKSAGFLDRAYENAAYVDMDEDQ
jgi:hypothetical protein